MKIELKDVGKRFNREWIFRHFDYAFLQGNSYAITGTNGSGKSTLLQVIAGAILNSEGAVEYSVNGKLTQESYKFISIATPYLELIEELTAEELLSFHSKFKPLKISITDILQTVGLASSAKKQIRYFSSGMKQRLKLGQAFFSESSCLFLDEPSTNLDLEGIALYHDLLANHCGKNRTIIISSNDKEEYSICKEIIRMEDYK